jgi:hypothetical protein
MTHPKSINGLRIAGGLKPIEVEESDPLYSWYNKPPERVVLLSADDIAARIKLLNGETDGE